MRADDYLQGRIDKACLIQRDSPDDVAEEMMKIDLMARLKDPFAVLLR
jgi:hypothetical protein